MKYLERFNYRDLIIFILPVLLFSLYLFTYNPGILTADSFSLLHQIKTGHLSNAYPIFYTFLVMVFLKNPLFVGIFQILTFSVMWTAICKYHRKGENTNVFFIQFILTLIISLIPINAVYSVALSSYALFSYFIMFLAFLIKIMVDRDGQIGMKLTVLMAVTMAFISGLAPYGAIISLISLVFIAAYILIKRQDPKRVVALTVAGVIVIASLTLIFGVAAGDEISSTDLLSDDINLDDAKSQYFTQINQTPEDFEDLTAANLKNSKYDQIDSIVDLTRENIILNTLLNNPIIYFVLAILALGFAYVTTKSKEIWMVYVPSIATIALALITSKINLYSNLLVFYLILIIIVDLLFKKKTNFQEKPPEEEIVYDSFESVIDEITLDEINEMLGESEETEPLEEIETEQTSYSQNEGSSDLIDEILKEIESGKK
ncbi:MAG: hypothetical protein IJF83_03490 [Methanobrevibacter sp.]|nr:hypothetical protein [Methanobrevibacter sp.]